MKNLNLTFKKKLPIVCVQGLGVVGSAMALAAASAKKNQRSKFNVVGLEKENKFGQEIIKKLNIGKFPFQTSDKVIIKKASKLILEKNFIATTDISLLAEADIIISSIGLDFFSNQNSNIDNFKNAITDIAKFIKKNSLFILESSVPPGTTEKIVLPIFKREFKKRNLNEKDIKISYSYERVMPGSNYYNSIVNYWRVFSSNNDTAKKKCENFLSKIINVKKYPLTYLDTFTSCELSKILENTYRAINIALVDEWSKFAEKNNIDLFKIINAIRVRPSHKNLMLPGFGVGGYCLTKDPLFGDIASKKIFNYKSLNFPISKMSVKINNNMPLHIFDQIKKNFKILKNKKILILGATYKDGIDDVRFSPTEILASKLIKQKANVKIYDQYVKIWKKFEKNMTNKIDYTEKYDAVVLTISNKFYKKIKLDKIPISKKSILIDANNVLSHNMLDKLKKKRMKIFSVGRGYID